MKKQLKFLLFAVLMLTLVMMTMICACAAADGDTQASVEEAGGTFNEADYNFKVSANEGGSDATYYLDMYVAFDNVPDNGYVFMLKSVSYTSQTYLCSNAETKPSKVTFVGKEGVTLTTSQPINVSYGIEFEFLNVNVTSTNKYYGLRFTATTGTKVTINGGTYNCTGPLAHLQENNATLTIKGGAIINANTGGSANGSTAINTQGSTTGHVINVESATINNVGTSGKFVLVNSGVGIEVNISGGSITTKQQIVYIKSGDATVNVSGGKLTNQAAHAFASTGTGGSLTLNISGGTVDADTGKYSLCSLGIPLDLTVTGGEIYVGSQIAYINALSTLNFKGGEITIASTSTSHGISGGNYDHTFVFGFSAEEKAAAKAEGKTLTDVKIFQNSTKNIMSMGAGSNGASYTFNGGEFTFAGGTGFYIGTKATLNVLGGTFTYTGTSTTAMVFSYAAAGTVNLKNAEFNTKGIVLYANNASITANVENVSVENAYAVVKTSKGNTINFSGTIDGGFSYAVEFMTSALATVNVLEGASITTNSATFLVNDATAVGKVIVNDATIVSGYSVFHNLGALTVEVNDSAITCGDSSIFIATATATTNATVTNSILYTNAHLLYNASKTEEVEGEDGSPETVVTNASTTLSLENCVLIKLDLVTENKDQLVLDDVAEGGVTLTITNFTVLAKKGTMLGADTIIGDHAPAVKFGGVVYYAYMTTEGAAINKTGAEIYMGLDEKGNLVDGIRFTSELSAEVIALAKAGLDAGKTVSYGMVIAPADYVVAAGTFTKAALDEAFGSKNGVLDTKNIYVDVPAKNSLRDANKDGVYESFTAMLVNIKEANYTRAFAAVGYVVIDGEIIYSAYNTLDNVRSAKQVATTLLESGYYEGETDMIAILNKYAGVVAE